MATTTSNFSWTIPQSTDLVKDGATAIASLGSGIDTSMAELKGGTTGQILSKTSNTDMDFTWITPNPGDITGVTAGTGITGGGTSGDVTVSFDVANYGGGQYAAGKNKIINGDFGIWQRGTTFTSPANGAYTADRWKLGFDGTGTCTVSQQTFTAGTAPVAGYEGTYFLRHLITSAGTTSFTQVFSPIEDVRTFAGQTVTFSFWAKADTARSSFIYAEQNFGSGGSATVQYLSMGSASLTTSWQRFSFTVALSSIAGKTIGTGSSLNFYIRNGTTLNATLDIWGVQLEAGSTATPFQTATGTIQGEFAACQRYYYKHAASGLNSPITNSAAYSATSELGIVTFPVTMRTSPTFAVTSGTNYYQIVANGGGDSINSLTQDSSNANASIIYNNTEVAQTAGHAGIFISNNASSSIAWSAEL